MEKKPTSKVAVLLLPLFFTKVKFENEKHKFLSFSEMVKNDSSFDFFGHHDHSKESIISLFEKIDNHNFSDYLLENLKKASFAETEKKMVLVNFPSNIEQFKNISLKLSQEGFSISKIIISSFETFESFEKVSSNIFTCPFCLNSFDKASCLADEKSLICPIDKKIASLSFCQKFTKSFSEHYFKKSIDFAQSLSLIKENEFYEKPTIIPLIIPEIDSVEDFLIRKISEIF